MNPLPPPLGDGELVGWRLDPAEFKDTWESGIGAARFGGRWNSIGTHVVYGALDPATALIEVAVHVGFNAMDRTPHVLTSFTLSDPGRIRVVNPAEIPNPNWLRPGRPTAGQRRFGDSLLSAHGMLLIPSAVSTYSWNLVFLAGSHAPYQLRMQERFALDTRLAP